VLAIVQSRLNSRRLPGKALLPMGCSTILGLCVKRVCSAKLVSKTFVSTSLESSDNKIVEFCKNNKINSFRGSLEDVGKRLLDTALSCRQERFLRICGDSPFIDPSIIDEAISISKTSDFDLVTNVFPRSFPKGQSVEVIRTKTMQQICSKKRTKAEKEHATSYFYDNHHQYRICSFNSGADQANSRQCIDDEKDYKIAKDLVDLNDTNDLGWKEIQRLWNSPK
jgi:spore coat polysaccharide biosynthesis protein SpsF